MSNIVIFYFKFPYSHQVREGSGETEYSVFYSYHHCRLQGCYIFLLRQFCVVIPAYESGKVNAVSQQRSYWKRLERRKCGEPGGKENTLMNCEDEANAKKKIDRQLHRSNLSGFSKYTNSLTKKPLQ